MKFFLLLFVSLGSIVQVVAQRACGTGAYWQTLLKQDPEMRARYTRIEGAADELLPVSKKSQETGIAEAPVITIPVVIHVLYQTAEQNISDGRIQSQIKILNDDFRKRNSDTSLIPAAFASLSADCGIQFELAKQDPEGRPTTGIIRKRTDQVSWQQDDKMKFSASGGNDAWDSRYYLNIWVCNLNRSLLGYATFPGAAPEKDGVVIRTDVFGISGSQSSSYSRGRTTTHEVGHWLNLKHLWGDADCGDDGVEDTPPQKTFNSGCPSFPHVSPNSCNPLPSGDMFMNFMDFSDDACLHMFTFGQRQRIQQLFLPAGPRASFLQSAALDEPWNFTDVPVNENNAARSLLNVFPNPASEQITLRSADRHILKEGAYSIYDFTGRLVISGFVTDSRYIRIHRLKSGIYLIRIQSSSNSLSAKFIKE